MGNTHEALIDALGACKAKFARYVQYHAAKGSGSKEADNQAMVDMIDAAIAAANAEEAKPAPEPVAWYITDDNGEPFAATVYPHEAQQWRDQGKQVHESFAAS